jgi:hypothetical protein
LFTYDSTAADTYKGGTDDDETGTEDTDNSEYDATVRIIGKQTTLTDGDIVVSDDDLSRTVANINAATSNTDVSAKIVEQNTTDDYDQNGTIMLYYTGNGVSIANRISKIDLQEWGVGFDLFTEKDASSSLADSNKTVFGAIRRMWNVSTIVQTVPSYSSDLFDGNYTTSSGGVGFSVATSDVRNTPHYAEAFPIDGPLYDIKTTNLKNPELFLTASTSRGSAEYISDQLSSAFISWKQIDVTTPSKEWYDKDNQFELFWTEKEKGYWVYINGDNTIDISFDGTPTLAGSVYAHFDNEVDSGTGKGTTRNHMDKTLTLKIDGLVTYGNAVSNTDSYEVYATINGYNTSFERDSATNTFTIPLDSHETDGLDGNNYSDSSEVTVSIVATNGVGEKASTTYTLDFAKPDITSVSLSTSTATVAITNGTSAASEIQVYTADINDSDYGSSGTTHWAGSQTVAGDTTDINLASFSALGFPTTTRSDDNTNAFDVLYEQVSVGFIYEVRFTAKDANDLYANQYRLYYAPLYNGSGVLSSSDSSSSGYDASPVVYTSAGAQDSTWSGDDGVQIKTAVNGTTAAIAYKHQALKLDEATAISKTIQSGGTNLAVVNYQPGYAQKPFYFTFGDKTYVGYFTSDSSDPYIQVTELKKVSVSVVKSSGGGGA